MEKGDTEINEASINEKIDWDTWDEVIADRYSEDYVGAEKYQDVDTCIQNLIALRDFKGGEGLVQQYQHAVESAIHWLEECTRKLSGKG